MILCSICARGGSKGVKNKNLRLVNGIPLIAHSILQAKKTGIFDSIAVSSDSQEILNIARDYDVDYLIERPEELASDTAAKLPVIQHCARAVEEISLKTFDIFVDIDATSPLRIPQDIIDAVEALNNSKAGNLITGCESRRSPFFNMVEAREDQTVTLVKQAPENIVRRQDAPKTYDMNASVYVWKRAHFFGANRVLEKDTILLPMPEERSLDIDSEFDFKIVSFIMENSLNVK